MKSVFILIIVTTFKSGVLAEDFWSRQPSPTNRNLKNVFFINKNTGWITGDSGIILRTTNAGSNWVFQNSGVFIDIQSSYFINERLGWALKNKEPKPLVYIYIKLKIKL